MKKSQLVRQYVLSKLACARTSSIQIMSAREMAAHFQIALSTVVLELRKLTQEGCIISRPGIGTFTNPRKFYQDNILSRVGFLLGSGGLFSFSHAPDKDSREPFVNQHLYWDGLLKQNFHVQQIYLRENAPEKMFRYFQQENLDAVAWYTLAIPDAEKYIPVFQELKEAGIKLVCQTPSPLEGINTVTSDFVPEIVKMAKALAARNYRKVLLLCGRQTFPCDIKAIFDAEFIPRKIEYDIREIPRYELADPRKIGSLIGLDYDCVVIEKSLHTEYRRFLSENHRKADIFCWIHYLDEEERFVRIKENIPVIADTIGERLAQMLAGDTECKHIKIPMLKIFRDSPDENQGGVEC